MDVPPQMLPTLFSPGILGSERARRAQALLRASLLESPMAPAVRTALLCATLERPEEGSPLHATGLTLAGQGDEMVDLAGVWAGMRDDSKARRLLRATVDLGQGRTVPPQVLLEVHEQLGPWMASWQDLVAFSAWSDALHRTQLPLSLPHPDPRLDEWLGRVVGAADFLPPHY